MRSSTEIAADLDALTGQEDPEADHARADDLLLEAAPDTVADAFQRLAARARWWATS